ncbi:hypothetical protein [Botrimarina mediterranea]|uniref:PEP-CTERM protein-sorting domain-containing protein n=1 Tax=Botrimarina mediterranea TaxID=2528022 RepID=A0A518KDQ8_9BACT|nr:hypothetical protein [Botrimarina mediterranea]QDV75926.1 hypothetical protein Spa11_41490 [Botrimarina mediterranea]QDV80521.1 hypothetical protein K2D_41500 [Planctomycetes bacterium K2D]
MSWKSIACVAALGAMAAPALALPTIEVVDNGSGMGSINIITTDAGSIGAEIALELTGATLTGATINSAVFDTANPGDNPYIAGSPIAGDTTGLGLDLPNNRLFASYGSGDVAAGSHKLLDFTYTGTGTGTAFGVVGSVGLLEEGLNTGAVDLGSGPDPLAGDFDGSGAVGDGDLTLLLSNWGAAVPPVPAGWTGTQPTAPGVGDDELTGLLSTWGQSSSSAVAVPEPTAALLGLIGVACLSFRRSA